MEKTSLTRCLKLLDIGFSLITVSADKTPNIRWKKYQTSAMDKDTFENFYNMDSTKGVGIVTGFDNLEGIDVDLKVIKDLKERQQFWTDFLQLLKDNIYDFEEKVIIVKTKNDGYHLLYKNKNVCGNKKIAKFKAYKEAVIESRGVGGYVWIYDQFIQGKGYANIKEITDEERDIIWHTAKLFNYVEKQDEIYSQKSNSKEFEKATLTVWDDYNEKNSAFDIIQDDFKIVKKTDNITVLKRIGSDKPSAGSIFNDNGCVYLFTTGTVYPNEKLLSPFALITYKKYNGDFKLSTKELYKEGYGSRIIVKKLENSINIDSELKIKTDEFPIDILPESIQNYIISVHKTLNASIDYLGCSFLWILSLCIGNSIKIEVKKGWIEAGVLWIAIVGKAGIGKTHNIQSMTFPLTKVNEREIKRYNDHLQKYLTYKELSKKEKETAEEVKEPYKTQFIVGDITLESFFDHHEQNKNGIGILRDELSSWIKDLNKYRPGSDLETYLSCWSNQQILLNRKSAKSSYVSKAFVPIIGGVQPSILSMHYTPENKENGFIDRILLCYPSLEVERYNENEMEDSLINWYENYVIGFFETIKAKLINYDDFGNVNSYKARFSNDAKKEWVRIFDKITDLQNSEEENEYMKSILPKQKSYVARFALILNTLYSYDDDNLCATVITKKAIVNAEKLSDYFIKMAKKNKFDALEKNEMIDTIKFSGAKKPKDKFKVIYESNPTINKTVIADQLNVSRQTITRWVLDYEQKNVTVK